MVGKITRRQMLGLAGGAVVVSPALDGFWLEPEWLRVVRLRLSEQPQVRLVHVTDLHYKGEERYLARVVDRINALSPDFVCFTGDIVEDASRLDAALEALSRVSCPLYGVPGNHDYGSGASFARIQACFEATGGAWLEDRSVVSCKRGVEITGRTALGSFLEHIYPGRRFPESPRQHSGVPARAYRKGGCTPGLGQAHTEKRILLVHYPAFVDQEKIGAFDLVLAGHSHGGQVRLPGIGSLILPHGVGRYDRGLFQTRAGPLYVNPGIGTWLIRVRFGCRPELTVIEL